MKRGFWAHQFVEYLLGIGAIATGAQSPKPLYPCLAGGLLLLNGASTEGPLAAFKLIPRRLHRFGDIAVILFMVVAAAVAHREIDSAGRVVLVGLAIVHTFVTLRTDYSKRVPKERTDLRSMDREELGRMAGHVSGKAYNAVRRKGKAAGGAAGERSSRAAASTTAADAAQAAGRASANLLNALKERKKS